MFKENKNLSKIDKKTIPVFIRHPSNIKNYKETVDGSMWRKKMKTIWF